MAEARFKQRSKSSSSYEERPALTLRRVEAATLARFAGDLQIAGLKLASLVVWHRDRIEAQIIALLELRLHRLHLLAASHEIDELLS